MSIVVTCSCSRTYRLPDRYAGKKARCRDCGEPIEVPTQEDDAVEKPAQKRKKGESRSERSKADRKADKARETTRRLNAEDREIIGERRNLRSSERKRPISESMHQLAPIALSGDRLDMSPTPPSTSRSRPTTKKKTKREVQESKKKAKEQARSARDAEERKAAKKDKKKKKKKKSRGSAKDETKAQKKAAKARTTKLIQGPEGPSRAPVTKKAEKAKTVKRPLTGAKFRGRSSGEELEEGAEPLPQDLVSRISRLPVPALLGIAAVLCLGIGLIVGGLMGGGPKSPAEDKRVVKLQQLVNERKWVEAKAELEIATMTTKGHGDELVAAHVRALGRTVGPMAMIMELPDAGARMRVLADNIAVPDAMVRKAIAVELCDMASEEKAQKALQLLAKDLDPRVAAEAKKGLRADFQADEPEAPAAPAKAPEAPAGE